MKWILALWVLAMLIPSLVQAATAAKEDYRAYFNKEYVAAGFTTPPSSVPGIWSIWAEEDLFGVRAVIMSNHPVFDDGGAIAPLYGCGSRGHEDRKDWLEKIAARKR